MITEKDLLADMHTHTIFSLHAHSTVKENALVAKAKGYKYIGITDHFIGYKDSINRSNQVARLTTLSMCNNDDCVLIPSFEFNVGQDIYDKRAYNKTKWKPIGLHRNFLEEEIKSIDELYQKYVIYANSFNCFIHIERDLDFYLSDEEKKNSENIINDFLIKICKLAKDNNIYLELNELSFRKGYYDRIKYWLTFAKENGNLISLGSDAHYCDDVGDFKYSIDLINEIDFPINRILNCDEEKIKEFI